ncbi:MAG: hypothetical protein KC733_07075, partial [Candidatus Omnitrophica bacterium]|nr:hypothetical protein [Candidatus Omnitrophota bacterium]
TRANIVHSLDFGTEISHITYEEPDVMEEKGIMYGVFGVYTMREDANVKVQSFSDFFSNYVHNRMARVDAKFSAGQVDYESNGTGTIDDIDDYMFEVRGVLGYDFMVGAESLITPYLGVGYRYLTDKLGGKISTTGHFGYDRETHYLYMPFGLDFLVPLRNSWKVVFNAEYDLFLDGTQESHLEDVSPSLNTLENNQDSGYGVRGSIKFLKTSEDINFFIEPFIRYWNIDESDTATISCGGTPCALGFEPKNESTEAGVKIGINW